MNSPLVKGAVLTATGLAIWGLKTVLEEHGLLNDKSAAVQFILIGGTIAAAGLCIGGMSKAVGLM